MCIRDRLPLAHLNCTEPPTRVKVSAEVESHGSSIQWSGDFHWTLCVSTLIQSGVDIASDGLAPLLNQGSQFSVFSRKNISSNYLDAAFAPLERHTMPAEAIV